LSSNQQIEQLVKKIEELQKENDRLQQHNQELTLKLNKDAMPINNATNILDTEKSTENIILSKDEKVKLFMDLFKGRTDVYAKRWISNKKIKRRL
jgi:hypothetical protein